MQCFKCRTPLPDDSRFCSSCGTDVSGDNVERTLAVDATPELQRMLQEELGEEYEVQRELGRGGMAVVFLAVDPHLGRQVAVKVLPPELTVINPGMVERFRREARMAATLDHPHIIPVFRVSTGGKLFWYVMKFLEGESLDHILKRDGQIDVRRAAQILEQTGDALEFAHRHKVVHRDVKPANLVLDDRGRVTVTDFGIAKALDANTLTASGSMIGTPYYMSPEQCTGKAVGPAADQYSLAVMAYQMLAGHVPFSGDSVVDVIRRHCMESPPPLREARPDLSPSVVAVVERALAKSAEDRFASTVEFAQAFSQAAQGQEITVAPPRSRSGPRMSETALASPIPGTLHGAPSRSRKWVWIAASAVVVLGGGGGVAVWLSMRTPEVLTTQAGAQQPGAQVPAATAPVGSAPPVAAEPVSQPPAAGAVTARLTLRGVPSGATVTLNGRRVRGSSADLDVGRRHVVSVAVAGAGTWADTITPRDARPLTRDVALRAPTTLAGTVPAQQAPAQAVQQQAVPSQAAPAPAGQPTAAPSQAPPAADAPAAEGRLSMTVSPTPTTIFVNGRRVDRPNLINFVVPPGRVTLRFEGVDSIGPWWADHALDVAPGETVRRTRLPLQPRRQP